VPDQLLSSLVVSLVDDDDDAPAAPGRWPNVHFHSRVRFRRPATGVSGQASLSSSEDDSRLSPARGDFGRGELSSDKKDKLGLSGGDGDSESDGSAFLEVSELVEFSSVEDEESVETVESRDDIVAVDDSISECARVYLVVVISSSSGVRNATRFSAGNIGRDAILRGLIWLVASMDTTLCGCL
jgi:hypothetical protein